MAVDLAEIVERTRKLKRRLALGPLGYGADEVFREPFLDLPHLIELRTKVAGDAACRKAKMRAEAKDCLRDLDAIIAAMNDSPPRPPDDELCRRFSGGTIDVRTVMHITGWSLEELYDECSRHGFRID